MVSTFKIGTEVLSNHGQAKIERIEVVEPGQKEDGISVNEFYWSLKDNVVVDLDNGHWAYGSTIEPVRAMTAEEHYEKVVKLFDPKNRDPLQKA